MQELSRIYQDKIVRAVMVATIMVVVWAWFNNLEEVGWLYQLAWFIGLVCISSTVCGILVGHLSQLPRNSRGFKISQVVLLTEILIGFGLIVWSILTMTSGVSSVDALVAGSVAFSLMSIFGFVSFLVASFYVSEA